MISDLREQLYDARRQLMDRDLLIEQLRTQIAQLTTDLGRSNYRGVAMDEAGPSGTAMTPDQGIEVMNNTVGIVVRVEENMLGEDEHRGGVGEDNALEVEGEQGVPVGVIEEEPEEDPEEGPVEDPVMMAPVDEEIQVDDVWVEQEEEEVEEEEEEEEVPNFVWEQEQMDDEDEGEDEDEDEDVDEDAESVITDAFD